MFELTIPEDIEMEDLVTEKKNGNKVKFVQWVRANLLTDRRMNGGPGLATNVTVRTELRDDDGDDKETGDRLRFHPNDHELLCTVAKNPQYLNAMNGQVTEGYGPNGYQFQKFIDALTGAKRVEKGANGAAKKTAKKTPAADKPASDDAS